MDSFRERKYLDWFRCLDADNNGLLERVDFEHSAQHIARALGWASDAPALKRLRAAQDDYWTGLLAHSDTALPNAMRAAEFASFCDKVCAQIATEGLIPPFVMELALSYHRALDLDGDGQIDQAEYAAYLASIGSDADPAAAFARLDGASSGTVTFEQMAGLLLGWITADGPDHPGNYLATGRLT
jgi:Ca2+-binding EF-hand superfamily protein